MEGGKNTTCEHYMKVSVAALVSGRTDFKAREDIWDKERHYLMIKGSNSPRC